MSEKTKKDASLEKGGEKTPLSPTLEELLAGYEAEMEALYENRRRRAAERANMSEEEQLAAMVADYEAVYADARESGMDIITLPEDDDED